MNLLNFFRKKRELPNWFLILGVVFSFFGLVNATYLSYEHLSYKFNNSHHMEICFFDDFAVIDCNMVTTSEYSVMLGIPLAVWGVFYYLLIFTFFVLLVKYGYLKRIVTLSLLFSLFGFLFSFWLLFVQLYLLHAMCSFCIFSLFMSIGLFVIDIILFFTKKEFKKDLLGI